VTSVVIVDDHGGFRASARELLELEGFEVIGEAVRAEDAVEVCSALRPEVVLLDVHLPDGSGLEVAEKLRAALPGTAVVLVSSRGATDFGPRLTGCGAAGFIPKDALSGDAVRGVLAV